MVDWPPTLPSWSDLAFNEENSWLIVPMLLGGMVVVGIIGGLLLEHLPRSRGWDNPIIFVGGVVLATVGVVAIIMTVAITRLGCCGEAPIRNRGVVIEKNIFDGARFLGGNTADTYRIKLQNETGWFWVGLGDSDYMRDVWTDIKVGDQCTKRGRGYLAWSCN